MRVLVPGGTAGAPALLLREFGAEDEAAARAAHRELAPENFDFLLEPDLAPHPAHDRVEPAAAGTGARGPAGVAWADWLRHQAATARGEDLPPGRVPAWFLAAEVDGELVGRVSVRLDLNDWLYSVGGHIGYAVRPAFRRRGYAARILRGGLEVLRRERGLGEAVVVCDPDNGASAAVIRSVGGVLAPVEGSEYNLRFEVPVPAR